MTIKSSVLAVAAAAATAAAVLPMADAPAAPNASFTLRSKLDKPTLHRIDNGKRGDSGGDMFVLSTTLSRDGKVAGRAEYVQTAVDDRYRGISMTVHLLLADGTIELQGGGIERKAPGLPKPGSESDFAVVGGTGAYAGAGGTVHPVDVKGQQELQVHLEG